MTVSNGTIKTLFPSVPYRDKIRAAMNEIESKTCIRFRMRLFSRDYVNMGSGAG